MVEHDYVIANKDMEIAKLQRIQILEEDPHKKVSREEDSAAHIDINAREDASFQEKFMHRPGKTPPIDSFTGKEAETCLDDFQLWIGQRSAGDKLLYLAGHLTGRALLSDHLERDTYTTAVVSFHACLDPVSKTLAEGGISD